MTSIFLFFCGLIAFCVYIAVLLQLGSSFIEIIKKLLDK